MLLGVKNFKKCNLTPPIIKHRRVLSLSKIIKLAVLFSIPFEYSITEVYSEPSQTFKIELYEKQVAVAVCRQLLLQKAPSLRFTGF